MSLSFWRAFLISFTIMLGMIAAAGWMAARWLTAPPPEKYVSSTFEFELAKGWKCESEGTEVICQITDDKKRARQAIIIMARKYRGPQDSLRAYEAHLKQPRQLPPVGDDPDKQQPLQSDVLHVEHRRLAGHEWVDSLHFQSEIPNYFTHYMAAVTARVGVLVTFSVHRDHYQEHLGSFRKMMDSLTLYQAF